MLFVHFPLPTLMRANSRLQPHLGSTCSPSTRDGYANLNITAHGDDPLKSRASPHVPGCLSVHVLHPPVRGWPVREDSIILSASPWPAVDLLHPCSTRDRC
jgi:hypothetical protein